MKGVSRVSLTVSASGEQSGACRQRGGDVDDTLAGRGELLGDTAAQAAGPFDSEPSLRPLLAPRHQLAEGSGIDWQSALPNLFAGVVDGDCGVGGLVRINSDQDHGVPALRSRGWDVRWAP